MDRARLGIRLKFAITLTLVALGPMTAALVGAIERWGNARMNMAGQAALAVAAARELALDILIVKDVQGFQTAIEETEAVWTLSQYASEPPPRPPDKAWTTMPHNPIVRGLAGIKRDPRVLAVLVTDRQGYIVGSTAQTERANVADDAWWREAYNDGKGRIVLFHVGPEPSAHKYSVNLAFPVMEAGKVVGICRTELDLSRWMRTPGGSLPVAGREMLVRRDGMIVYARGVEPLSVSVSDWTGAIAAGRESGWRTTDDEVQAFVPVRLEEPPEGIEIRLPDWSLVISIDRASVIGPVYKYAAIAMGTGLLGIAALFMAGIYLIDRTVVRRLRRLREAAHRVAGGDLTGRAEERAKRRLGSDEIDDLVRDFNEMIARVKLSHDGLASANELKSNFIQVAGHELRTPVSYILGLVKLLKDNRDVDRLQQALQSVGSRARRLDDIIKAMFKLMPDEFYQEVVRYEDVSMPELLEEIYLECFPFVERRGQRLIISAAKPLPSVRADREKLRDVIENLVNNAIKFTPDGGQVRLSVSAEAGGTLTISVQDQGPGIPEKDLPHLFQPFYSGGEVLQHSTGDMGFQKRGLGLGLAIVRHFVELHGGTVTVSSSTSGSTFTVVIPTAPPPGQGSCAGN
ncbi:MAG: ATP-binding protein [Phycisphaerae bacterium]